MKSINGVLLSRRLAYDSRLQNRVGDYIPMQLVVPSAVRIAEAIDTIICIAHFKVSFFVMIQIFKGFKNLVVRGEWLVVRD